MASFQNSEVNKQGGKQKVSENRTKDILQTIYTLNKSGTKRVTLGLDSGLDFEPFVQLHKPGFDGVRIPSAVWNELLVASPYITSFFKGEFRPERLQDELLLGPMEKITFRRNFNRNLVSIASVLDDKKEVVLADSTWKRLLELAPCISYCLANMAFWQSEAMEMFTAFARAVKNTLPPTPMTTNIPHPQAFNNLNFLRNTTSNGAVSYNELVMVQSLSYSNLVFCSKNIAMMDYQKCFYELQAFCTNEIVSYAAYV